ncbi:hypothetical protein N8217_03800 [Glaciecola sp.]|nr:hypothetical protein [Glaciecola sp.]
MPTCNYVFLIVNYNSSYETNQFIRHVNQLDLKFSYSFVVVDNYYSDSQLEALKSYVCLYDNVDLLESKTNSGYACGNNIGLKYIFEKKIGDVVYVCNNDIEFKDPSFFYELNNGLATYDFVSARMEIASVTQNLDFRKKELLDDIASFIPKKLKVAQVSRKNASAGKWIHADWLNGSFFSGNISSFADIDYFDERTFLYCEERILGARAVSFNKSMAVHSELTYKHTEGAITTTSFNRFYLMEYLCDSRQVFYKYYTSGYKKILGTLFHKFVGSIFRVLKI